jgi:hypothetical protein
MPASREVKNRKLTERCFSSSVVSLCGFFFDVVSRVQYLLASEFELSFPHILALAPRNAAIPASVSKIGSISCALAGICYPQITKTVIQRIAVYVVSIFSVTLRQPKNLAMHVGALVFPIFNERAGSVKRTVWTFPCEPFPSAKFGLRGLIYDRELALSEFDNELSMFHRYTPFQGITR